MNNVKKTQKQFFEDATFSEESKQKVLQKMNDKKKVYWKPVAAFLAVAALSAVIISTNDDSSNTASEIDRSSIEQYFESVYNHDESEQKASLLHVQEGVFKKNDAVLVSKYDESDYLQISYIENIDGKWFMKGSVGLSLDKSEDGFLFQRIMFDDLQLFVGLLNGTNQSAKVTVGKKEAIYLEGFEDIWIQQAETDGTPVFIQRPNEQKVRLFDMPDFFSGHDEIGVQLQGTNQTVYENNSDAMVGVYSNYAEHPLLIDEAYYEKGEPSISDVVLIEKEGTQFLVRVKGVSNSSIEVREGSVLIDGRFWDQRYLVAQVNGSVDVDFTNETPRQYMLGEQQYFVQSDNWGSDDFYEGIVMKEEIIGKVMAYSLLDIEPNLTQFELDLYDEYLKTKEDALLEGHKADYVYRLQKYALYKGDYETAYALFAENSIQLSEQEWIASYKEMDNEIIRHLNAYYLNLVKNANAEINGERHIFTVPTIQSNQRTLGVMVKQGNLYKVEYNGMIDVTLN